MAILKQIKFGTGASTPIAKTIVNGKGVIAVTNTGGRKNDLTEQEDYSYDIDVNVDGSTIVKDGGQLAVGNVPAAKVSVAKVEGLTSTDAQSAFQELKGKIDDVKGAAKSYEIVKETTGLETNVKEQYKLKQTIGESSEFVGETIKIYKDSSLKSVALDGQNLVFTYILANGKESVVRVDVSTFLAESEFADGLVVDNHVVKVKVDTDSEGFLTVGEAGVKLSGVQDAINAAVEALDVTDTASAGMYVSAVSETNGKISVERLNVADAVLNGYAKGEKPASTEILATDKVKDAISKLEHQVDAAKAAATTKVAKDASSTHLTLNSAQADDGSVTYTIGENDIASATALSAEITARKAVDGQTGDTYAANAGTNYISGATSLNDADVKLDAELKKEADRAQKAEQEIATKVNAIKYNVDGTTLIVVGIPQDETLKANKA